MQDDTYQDQAKIDSEVARFCLGIFLIYQTAPRPYNGYDRRRMRCHLMSL
jgi:hypothetical protein